MTADATRLRQAVQSWSASVARAAARETPDAIRNEAPVGQPDPLGRGYVPGETRRSIRYEGGSSDGVRHTHRVIAPTLQARTSSEGSPAHVIRPRGPYPLRFFWRRVGSVVVTFGWHGERFGRVDHPGNAPSHWWPLALRKHWPGQLRRAARSTPF